MQKPKILSGERPEITLVMSDKDDDYLKDVHCVVCGRILFQSWSSVRSIIPGLPERDQHDQHSRVILCKNSITVMKDGHRINANCNTRYLIT